jgi:hypothetical protein
MAGFGNNNEEIYIYSANSITDSTPTAFIYGVSIGTSTSERPAGLTTGTTFIEPQGAASRYKTTGAVYSGTQSALLTAIGNTTSNWEAVAPAATGDWTFNVQAPVAPMFTGATVNGSDNTFLNAAQRSQVTSLVLNFSAPVVINSGAFTLENIGLLTAQTPDALGASQILVTGSGTSQITLRWGAGAGVVTRNGSGALGNSLADGNWRLTINAANVTGQDGGLALSGNNLFGASATDNFFRMFGDSNGDGLLTSSDTAAFRAAFSSGSSSFGNAALDWDGDGTVSNATNSPDRINFLGNSGKRRRVGY